MKEILVLVRVEERRLRVSDRERQRKKKCFQTTGPAGRIGCHRCLSQYEGERWLSYGSRRGRVGRCTNREIGVTPCPRDASFSIPRPRSLCAHQSFAAERVPVIDTHLHCFAGSDQHEVPLSPERPLSAGRARHARAPSGVHEAEAGVDHADRRPPGTVPGRPPLPRTLPGGRQGQAQGHLPVLRGPARSPRKSAHSPGSCRWSRPASMPTAPTDYRPSASPNWGALEGGGRRRAGGATPLRAAVCRGLRAPDSRVREDRVFIDHLGRPFQGTAKEHAVVLGWAKYANVVMKLSSVPSRNNYPHRDAQPVVEQLTEAFGADRLMFGGGFSAVRDRPELSRRARAGCRFPDPSQRIGPVQGLWWNGREGDGICLRGRNLSSFGRISISRFGGVRLPQAQRLAMGWSFA